MFPADPDRPSPDRPSSVDPPPDEPDGHPAPDPVATAAAPLVASTARGPRRIPVVQVAIVIVAVLAGSALFLSGYSLGRRTASDPGTPVSQDTAFQPFWDTYHTIEDRYAGGSVDQTTVIQGAIRGMIGSLDDPFSAYMTSDEYRASLQSISGQFEGIGADIASLAPDGTQGCTPLGKACHLVITQPIDGSPAQRAGLSVGDVIAEVDGISVDGLTVDAARDKIRGPKGSVVQLAIQRGGAGAMSVTITRDVVQSEEVTSKSLAGGSVGYIKLSGFSDAAADQVVVTLRDQLAAGRTKLILDLRGNPGGYVTAARKIASQFIGSGIVFWQQDASGNQTPTEALTDGVATDPKVKVVVLIDGGSASASEIVAGALQDRGRAILVGQQSFGKGTIQQWQELTGQGGAFKLTIARWLTPDKHWIHKVGLTPDVVVKLPSPLPLGADPDLDKALEVLGAPGGGALGALGDAAA
jgi:carboxyl-terminal processing protease